MGDQQVVRHVPAQPGVARDDGVAACLHPLDHRRAHKELGRVERHDPWHVRVARQVGVIDGFARGDQGLVGQVGEVGRDVGAVRPAQRCHVEPLDDEQVAVAQLPGFGDAPGLRQPELVGVGEQHPVGVHPLLHLPHGVRQIAERLGPGECLGLHHPDARVVVEVRQPATLDVGGHEHMVDADAEMVPDAPVQHLRTVGVPDDGGEAGSGRHGAGSCSWGWGGPQSRNLV